MKSVLSLSFVIILASLAIVSTDVLAESSLDATEASHLTFMREEEKLARDVYLTFAAIYPNQKTFSNIATNAEQTHTDTMRDELDKYNLDDPNPNTNKLPESLGIFTGKEWGSYFHSKFTLLTEWGAGSELDALMAGAFIEELDMHDIAFCPEVMSEAGYGVLENIIIGSCGLKYTDEEELISAYKSLISGSEDHLRAYVGKIEAITGEPYVAQYISQKEVNAILGRVSPETQNEMNLSAIYLLL